MTRTKQRSAPVSPTTSLPAWVEDSIKDLPGLLDTEQAAAFLGLCPRTVTRWVRSGRLAVVKLSRGAVRIPRSEVARLLAAHVSK